MKYIIDGYNVVHQIEKLITKPLRSQRDDFITMLEVAQSQWKQLSDITVVFDGQRHVSSPQTPSTVKVIFSRTSCADKKIKDLVEQSTFARDIVVVSDDRQVRSSVKPLGAKCLFVQQFLKLLLPAQVRPSVFRLSEGEKDKINQELEGIWLKDS
ncbi:MAG: NYN domain-containing protein [Candidatus Omnitrophota bacterium]